MLGILFAFFLSNQMKNRKTLMVAIAGVIPIGIAILITGLGPILNRADMSFDPFFPRFTFLLYLHFLVPIIALFQGTGIIADEVEDKTLPYLIVRPIPRFLIVLSKYLACVFIGGVIIIVSLVVSYGILLLAPSLKSASSDISFLLHGGGVLLLGLSVYSALFMFFGGILRRPTALGILFAFGWETIIAYVPGNVRLFTVMSYLHALYPVLPPSKLIGVSPASNQVSDVTAIIVLPSLILIFGGISLILPSVKEYRLDMDQT